MSTIKVNTIEEATSGGATFYTAKAWVNFDGTGTVAIRGSGNISSIVDYGTGYYGANMSTAMSDANYACPSISGNSLTNPSDGHLAAVATSTSQVKARCYTSGTAAYDQGQVSISVIN